MIMGVGWAFVELDGENVALHNIICIWHIRHNNSKDYGGTAFDGYLILLGEVAKLRQKNIFPKTGSLVTKYCVFPLRQIHPRMIRVFMKRG